MRGLQERAVRCLSEKAVRYLSEKAVRGCNLLFLIP